LERRSNAAPYGYALDPVESFSWPRKSGSRYYTEMATEEGPYRPRALYMRPDCQIVMVVTP
jgi:hypothetical protein